MLAILKFDESLVNSKYIWVDFCLSWALGHSSSENSFIHSEILVGELISTHIKENHLIRFENRIVKIRLLNLLHELTLIVTNWAEYVEYILQGYIFTNDIEIIEIYLFENIILII